MKGFVLIRTDPSVEHKAILQNAIKFEVLDISTTSIKNKSSKNYYVTSIIKLLSSIDVFKISSLKLAKLSLSNKVSYIKSQFG